MKLFKPMSDIFITGDVWLGEGKIVPGSVEKTNNGIECDYLDCSSVPPKFPDAIMSDGAYWPQEDRPVSWPRPPQLTLVLRSC